MTTVSADCLACSSAVGSGRATQPTAPVNQSRYFTSIVGTEEESSGGLNGLAEAFLPCLSISADPSDNESDSSVAHIPSLLSVKTPSDNIQMLSSNDECPHENRCIIEHREY